MNQEIENLTRKYDKLRDECRRLKKFQAILNSGITHAEKTDTFIEDTRKDLNITIENSTVPERIKVVIKEMKSLWMVIEEKKKEKPIVSVPEESKDDLEQSLHESVEQNSHESVEQNLHESVEQSLHESVKQTKIEPREFEFPKGFFGSMDPFIGLTLHQFPKESLKLDPQTEALDKTPSGKSLSDHQKDVNLFNSLLLKYISVCRKDNKMKNIKRDLKIDFADCNLKDTICDFIGKYKSIYPRDYQDLLHYINSFKEVKTCTCNRTVHIWSKEKSDKYDIQGLLLITDTETINCSLCTKEKKKPQPRPKKGPKVKLTLSDEQ